MILTQLQAQILFICNGKKARKIMEIIGGLEDRKIQRSYNYICTQLRWLAGHGLLIKRDINYGKRKLGYDLKGHPSYYITSPRGLLLADEWKEFVNKRLCGRSGDRDSDSLMKYITKSDK